MHDRNGFTLEVSQNEYLPVDGGNAEMDAIVTVTGHGGAPEDVAPPQLAQVIMVDCSGSMGVPQEKIRAARQATIAAVTALREGTLFAVVKGTERAELVYPAPEEGLARASAATKAAAVAAVRRLIANGGTAMGPWLMLTRRLFADRPADVRHAILLTDGMNNDSAGLHQALDQCAGRFSCDSRGIGVDWDPTELKLIAERLNGTADAVKREEELEGDFAEITRKAMAKVVPSVLLSVRPLPGVRIQFLRQVYPETMTLPVSHVSEDGRTSTFDLGAWGEEVREYYLRLSIDEQIERRLGGEIRLARVDLHTAGAAQPLCPAAPILVRWTDDVVLSTRINPKVSHHTRQSELSNRVEAGYLAFTRGDRETAAAEWGRAFDLAVEVGNTTIRERLERLVHRDDDGVPRLREGIEDIDSKRMSVISRRSTLSPSKPAPAAPSTAPPVKCPDPACGYLSPPEASFCMKCGHRLNGGPEG